MLNKMSVNNSSETLQQPNRMEESYWLSCQEQTFRINMIDQSGFSIIRMLLSRAFFYLRHIYQIMSRMWVSRTCIDDTMDRSITET